MRMSTQEQTVAVARPVPSEVGRRDRILYLDVLRVAAAFAVVAVHTSSNALGAYWQRDAAYWHLAVVIDAATRWCVPAYLLLSGAFALTYRQRYTTAQFVRGRVVRIGIPFAVWSALYLGWEVVTGQLHVATWQDLWAVTVAGPAEYHLWFFYLLGALYLLTPALSVLIEHADRRLLWVLVGVSFSGSLIVAQGIFTHLSALVVSYVPVSPETGYVGWFVLGYLLATAPPLPAWLRATLYVLAVASIAFMAWATYTLTVPSAHATIDWLMGYTMPPVVVEALAVFCCVRAIAWERVFRWRWSRALLHGFALATFGVYLVHIAVKWYVDLAVASPALPGWLWWLRMPAGPFSIEYQLVAPLLIFVISMTLIIPLRHLPGVKVFVP